MCMVRVVILSYNTRDLLANCLRSLVAGPGSGDWHVVVVDNGSSDGSPEMVSAEFPGVTLLRSADNRGFSAGNNLGAAGATEPLLLFLNSDTVVPQGAIAALVAFVEQHPECAAAGPRLVFPDGSRQDSCRTFPGPLNTLLEGFWLDRLLPRSRFFGRPRMTWLDHDATLPVPYVSGAALLVRRERFEAVGGWPEAYFFYAEDAELCLALQRDGQQVMFHGDVRIVHYGGGSASPRTARAAVMATRAVLLFSQRNGGPGRLLGHRLAVLVTTLPRLVLAGLAWPVEVLRGRAGQGTERVRLCAAVLGVALGPVRPGR